MTMITSQVSDHNKSRDDWPRLEIIKPCPTMTTNEHNGNRKSTSSSPNNIIEMRISLRRLAISLMEEMHGLSEEESIEYKRVISKGFQPVGINFMDLL